MKRMVLALGWFCLLAGAQADEKTTTESLRGLYTVSYEPQLKPLAINRMHAWTVHIDDADGVPVTDAEIAITGGMPLHDHGLPTMPRATTNLGEGDYLVEGVKFHMAGGWQVVITITAGGLTDTVTIELEI